ncbi:30S ribosomal protein S9 [Candidatus Dojkabacteria bacterium]|uniref:30S ribosomal protein S9 n=1 Tax=Candidatus Dojkabacteria bacterium TaxID=2099670 RepID=A0A955I052_9BACT|nr:30S ribosomal protein S9 [Candidatus Dojkabacteria bacterium]
MADKFFEGIGRRKTSTARVRIYKGNKPSVVNDTPLEEYFSKKMDLNLLLMPLKVTNLEGEYYFTAKVSGGGTSGQRSAIRLGLARAIYKMDPEQKPVLRKHNLATRDPRMVERKLYDHIKSRKKPQFSKR